MPVGQSRGMKIDGNRRLHNREVRDGANIATAANLLLMPMHRRGGCGRHHKSATDRQQEEQSS